MSSNHLIIGMSCLYPQKYSKSLWGKREIDYLKSVKSFKNLKLNSDFILCDNSISDLDDIKNIELRTELMEIFDGVGYTPLLYGLPESYSERNNEGFRKLLVSTLNIDILNNYKIITIINLRLYILSKYWFHLVNELMINDKYEMLLLANKKISLNTLDKIHHTESCPIIDSIFSFKKDIFIKFCQVLLNMEDQYSDDVLYSFSQDKKYKIVENVGVVRNEWDIESQSTLIENFYVM